MSGNYFRIPRSDASTEEKQDALKAFSEILKLKLRDMTAEEQQKLLAKNSDLAAAKDGLNPGPGTENLLNDFSKQQEAVHGELRFEQKTNWDKEVDNFLKGLEK